MNANFKSTLDYFRRDITEKVKLAEEQKNLFLKFFMESDIAVAIKKKWATDLQNSGPLPTLVTPFGNIHVRFVLVPDSGQMSYVAVFFHSDHRGDESDLYSVRLLHSERPWQDNTSSSVQALPWDGEELAANIPTMAEILRRAIAALAHHNDAYVKSI